jgi:protein arginine kinase
VTIDDLLHQDSEWMKGTGPQSEVVMSSRTRLARNFEGFAYSHWADDAELEEAAV